MCRCPLSGYTLTTFVKVTFSFVFFSLLKSISIILKERELQQDESSWGADYTGNLVHVKQLCVRRQIFLSCLFFHIRKKYFRKIENSFERHTLWMIAVNKYNVLSWELRLHNGPVQADNLCKHTFMKALYFQTKWNLILIIVLLGSYT